MVPGVAAAPEAQCEGRYEESRSLLYFISLHTHDSARASPSADPLQGEPCGGTVSALAAS